MSCEKRLKVVRSRIYFFLACQPVVNKVPMKPAMNACSSATAVEKDLASHPRVLDHFETSDIEVSIVDHFASLRVPAIPPC